MPGGQTTSNKRKRPLTPSVPPDGSPPSKKFGRDPAKSAADSDAQQHSRKIIKAVYRRYNLLSDPNADGQDSAFEALLDACEGDPAARRLAARLVPRFAARFPGKLDTAARALMELSAWDGSQATARQAIAEAARLDALRGLGDICVAAALQASESRTVSSIIFHLLRRSQQSKARSKRGARADSLNTFSIALEQECIRASIIAILMGCPKPALAACFESLGYGSGELFEAAKAALAAFLELGGSKKNGLSHGKQGEHDCWVAKSLTGNAKLGEWLVTSVQALKGQSRDSEVNSLLEALLKSNPHKQKLPTTATQHKADPQKSSDSKLRDSSKGAKPSKGDYKPAKSDARAQRKPEAKSEERSTRAALPRDRAAYTAVKPERASAVEDTEPVKPRSSVPDRMLANCSAMRRVESGELAEEGTANGRPSSAGRIPSVERAPPRPGSADRGPFAALPRPGGGCCVAFECLWINGIATHMVGKPQLRRECEEHGAVNRILFLPPPARDQALVFFDEMRHAVACYEELNGETRLSRRPLEVQFCEDAPEVASRPDCPPRTHVWVALYSQSEVRREAVMHDLAGAGVPKPTGVTCVGGAVPGLLLQFSSAAIAAAAAKALDTGRRPPSLPSRSPPPPRSRSPLDRHSPSQRGRKPLLPEYATSTLWIGQVGLDVDEEELIGAFLRHGQLTGHKLLRSSNCGFIDFERVEDAAAAREALHNSKFGSCDIRVEFKEEGRALGRIPGFGGRNGSRFAGRGRGRGRFSDPRGRGFPDSPPSFHREVRMRESPVYGRSPPNGRSRSPIRHRSPPFGIRGWSPPPRATARGRWDSQGRAAGPSPPLDRDRQRRRLASPDLAQAERPSPPRRDAAEVLATSAAIHAVRAGRAASKWDAGPPAAAAAPPSRPPRNGPGPESPVAATSTGAKLGSSTPGQASRTTGSVPPLPSCRPPPLPQSPPGRAGRPSLPPQPGQTAAEQLTTSAAYSREGVQQASPSWSGKLAKSGSVVCSIQCLEGPRPEAGGASALEPIGWPSTLDVTLRIDIKYVLQTVSAGAVANLAAVRRLMLSPDPSLQAASQIRFKEFCEYLTTRGRAGVVQRIPPAGGLAERTMYLIPPSAAAAADLNVSWQPQEFMLMALIVPA